MERTDTHYQSFLIRIWREDQLTKVSKTEAAAFLDGASEDGWLFQLEDIASGDTRYFHTSSALAGYMDTKLRTDAEPPHPEENSH
jgi:hypothetical protein